MFETKSAAIQKSEKSTSNSRSLSKNRLKKTNSSRLLPKIDHSIVNKEDRIKDKVSKDIE